jgi:sterol desaturase/sphingolipid hydroxylase (fatty acid hydroxylase superfamily)
MQPRARRAPWSEIRAELVRLLAGHVLLVFPLAILIAYITGGKYIVVEHRWMPSWKLLIVQLVLGALVRDVLAWGVHRLLHTPFLYKHIHSVHHQNTAPYSLAGEHMHWFETIIHAIAPMTVGMMLSAQCAWWMYGQPAHIHIAVVWILLFNAQWRDVENHCGHDLPWMQFWSTWMRWYDGGVYHHDPHHSGFDFNFSTYWIDWLMGTTEVDYRRKRAARLDALAAGAGAGAATSPVSNGTTTTTTSPVADARPHQQ